MKALFIGGTGNISADCASLLQARGHEVILVSRGRSFVPPNYRVLVADRKDHASMRRALKDVRPDVVLNFLGYELADVELDYDLFRGGGLTQYIFISSATVYAKPPKELPIREEAPLGNRWWDYAQKKLLCEQWLLERWRRDQFPVTIVRPSHTYSQVWVPNPISSSSYTFASRLEQGKPVLVPDTGQTPWTLTAARDFAFGLAGLVGNPKALGEAFHITSDEVLNWNEICAEIAAGLGVRSPKIEPVPTDFICQIAPRMIGTLKGDKAHPGVFDNTKIKSLVPDFRCAIPFRDGVRESIAWLRQHPERQSLNPQVDEMIENILAAWQRAQTP